MKMDFSGNISLIPYLSDSYYQLLNELVDASKQFPELISYPAGAIIISTACIESYINELIYIYSFDLNPEKNKQIKKDLNKNGTDILKKLNELKSLAKKPDAIDKDLIDDVKILIMLRGRVAHYSVEEEYPNNKEVLSKLQRLEKYIFNNHESVGLVSTQRLLNPKTTLISMNITTEVIKSLYNSGYEPPRPRWIELIDPKRFGGNKQSLL